MLFYFFLTFWPPLEFALVSFPVHCDSFFVVVTTGQNPQNCANSAASILLTFLFLVISILLIASGFPVIMPPFFWICLVFILINDLESERLIILLFRQTKPSFLMSSWRTYWVIPKFKGSMSHHCLRLTWIFYFGFACHTLLFGVFHVMKE